MPEPETPDNGLESRDRLEALDRAVKDALNKRAAVQAEADARDARAQQARAGGAAWRTLSQLVLATTLLALAGYGLDMAIGSGPWGLLAGLFVGFGAGMWMAARGAARQQASANQKAQGIDAPAQQEGQNGDLR